MREIKFRGKDLLGKWRYGDFIQEKWKSILNTNEKAYMIKKDKRAWTVDKETLGQYTGLKDKNGVEIYEGDVINCNNRNFIVKFRKERGGFFPFACGDGCGCCEDEVISLYALEELTKIIGNIWDNPELLKESDNKCQN